MRPSHPDLAWRRFAELFIQVVVFYSIATYFIEVEYVGFDHSIAFFLWSERIVAAIFTVEYFVRWAQSRRWLYPLRPIALIDLAAVLPFYVGFFVDLRALRLVRTLRILRLLKLHRHNDALQHLVNAYVRVQYEFTIIGLAMLFVVWCSAVVIYEIEHAAQPENFARLSDAFWFVLATVTTVGYGDKVPITVAGRLVAAVTMLAGLTLFGTFISLIGSSFVEELRRNAPTGETPLARVETPSDGEVAGVER